MLNINILSPVTLFSMMLSGHDYVLSAVQVLTYFNNISSPFIYPLAIGAFREELKTTFRAVFSHIRSLIMCKRG